MVTTDSPRERGGGRLALLDALRFVAAMAVVLFHYTGRDSVAWTESVREVFPVLSRFTLYGGFGPYLFFMISGFVVLMSAWGRSVPSFIASRVGRLFPAYWFAVVFIAVALLFGRDLLPVWDELGPGGIGLNLTMLQSAFGVGHVDGVFWTLWIELKFYVLVAVLARIGLSSRRVLALCVLWPVCGALAAQTGLTWAVALLEPTYAPFFCIGIAVYLVYRNGWTLLTGFVLVLNYLAALFTATTYYVQWSLGAAGVGVSQRGIALLLTTCLLALMAATLTRLNRLSWSWLTLLGALTYPLYLVHEYPGWLLIHRFSSAASPRVVVGTVLVGAVLLAYAVHRWVERPLGPRLRRAVERELVVRHPVVDERPRRAARSNTLVVHRVYPPGLPPEAAPVAGDRRVAAPS